MKGTNRFEWSDSDVVVKPAAKKRLPDSKTLDKLKVKWGKQRASKKPR